jgi:hypothetical protein
MSITIIEANKIVARIEPIFQKVLDKYDFGKYPAANYDRFKTLFSSLNPPVDEIANAMIWKWGHWGKPDFPQSHKNLIAEIQMMWPQFVESGYSDTSARTFEWWRNRLNRQTTYITVSYITHLIHHAEPLPIIDQHNFRAMNSLIHWLRPEIEPKKKPSNWADIQSLKHFMTMLQAAKPSHSFSELDRFLMMYGRNCVGR